jgi:hypothetical protein
MLCRQNGKLSNSMLILAWPGKLEWRPNLPSYLAKTKISLRLNSTSIRPWSHGLAWQGKVKERRRPLRKKDILMAD